MPALLSPPAAARGASRLTARILLDRWYRVAGYDFGGTGTGLLANVSQIGFYGPPRTYQVTAQYHF